MKIPSSFMKTAVSLAVTGLAATIIAGLLAAQSSIIAPGAKLELLSSGFEFTEGCASDAAGNVYFSDQPNDRIHIWSVDGKLSTYMQGAGRANGMSFDSDGDLFICADEKNELWYIDRSGGKPDVIVKEYNGKLLNGPNDVWIRPNGGLYFTDPLFPRNYWKRSKTSEQDVQGVYYLQQHFKVMIRVVDDMKTPNGIIGTPDGKYLYIADLGAGKTYRYDIQPNGTLTNKKLFCEMGSDGMTIDNEGNVYLTGMGVTVFNPEGKQIEKIPITGWVGNVCFGGADRHTLFITASKNLYSMRMRVKGVGSQ
jgi:gluconolactonase